MNQETFNRIYDKELTPKQKKVLPLFLLGHSDESIISELYDKPCDRTLITQHLKNISRQFEILPERDTDYRNTLVELFWKYKPEIVSPERLRMSGLMVGKPPYPDSPLRSNSPFYIERPPIESNCYQHLSQPGTLLRIKSPHKMGKSSLIGKITSEAQQRNYCIVVLNLSLIETDQFANTEQFLLSFYDYIIQELPSSPPLPERTSHGLTILNLTRDMQHLLKHLGKVLVLVLDELDSLFNYPNIYKDFLPMLRHWYEKINTLETWENLRLVISHATDDYGRLGLNQSPFNVGIPIRLEKFNLEQSQNLASRHSLGRETILPLIDLVGGHPYLLRLAFYELYYEKTSFKKLLSDATTDTGIYKNHLLSLLESLQKNEILKNTFIDILHQNNQTNLRERTIEMYQLESMGLIEFENNLPMVSCRLYKDYFINRLL